TLAQAQAEMDGGRRGWGGRRGDEGWRGGGDWLLLSSIQWVAPVPSADVLGWLLLPAVWLGVLLLSSAVGRGWLTVAVVVARGAVADDIAIEGGWLTKLVVAERG
ncbi:MAG: hypothetical protein K8963_09475, partial [Proteobacteria bacterium]|nr:hypothetical protein [Pseudomonadota bacterium]